jgi:hypothetical protein
MEFFEGRHIADSAHEKRQPKLPFFIERSA